MDLGTIPIDVLYLLLLAFALATLIVVVVLVRRAKRIEARRSDALTEMHNDITGE